MMSKPFFDVWAMAEGDAQMRPLEKSLVGAPIDTAFMNRDAFCQAQAQRSSQRAQEQPR
jgi:hypothetical protein